MKQRGGRSRNQPLTRLRGHHLLCLYGFRGLGYDEDFVRNMTDLLQGLNRRPDQLVVLGETADDICRACPHLQNGGCAKRGEESEGSIRTHDNRILQRLEIEVGQVLPAWQLFRRVERRISPEDLFHLCEGCQWLALGYCGEGLGQKRIVACPNPKPDSTGKA